MSVVFAAAAVAQKIEGSEVRIVDTSGIFARFGSVCFQISKNCGERFGMERYSCCRWIFRRPCRIFHSLGKGWTKCIEVTRDYVEKYIFFLLPRQAENFSPSHLLRSFLSRKRPEDHGAIERRINGCNREPSREYVEERHDDGSTRFVCNWLTTTWLDAICAPRVLLEGPTSSTLVVTVIACSWRLLDFKIARRRLYILRLPRDFQRGRILAPIIP